MPDLPSESDSKARVASAMPRSCPEPGGLFHTSSSEVAAPQTGKKEMRRNTRAQQAKEDSQKSHVLKQPSTSPTASPHRGSGKHPVHKMPPRRLRLTSEVAKAAGCGFYED